MLDTGLEEQAWLGTAQASGRWHLPLLQPGMWVCALLKASSRGPSACPALPHFVLVGDVYVRWSTGYHPGTMILGPARWQAERAGRTGCAV